MNLPQKVYMLIGKPKPYRIPRRIMLYLVAYALAIVFVLLTEENA